MKFKQWLSNQTAKTFNIKPSATPGQLVLEILQSGQAEGEIDNLTDTDLRSLQQVLNQRFPPTSPLQQVASGATALPQNP